MKLFLMMINKHLFRICMLLVSLLFISCGNNNLKKQTNALKSIDTFTCAMHPQIIRAGPGNCPICGMALVKKETASHEITNDEVSSSLLRSTNTYVMSQIPVTTVEHTAKPVTVEALGRIDYDTRYLGSISAKVSGRIEKLYVKYRFERIHRGRPVMEIYSPELSTAQHELLFLLKSDQQDTTLIKAAKQKLLLLGLSNDQLNQVIQSGNIKSTVTVYSNYTGHIHEAIGMQSNPVAASSQMRIASQTEALSIKEGMYVEKGQSVFWIYNTDYGWIVLDFFPDQSSFVKVGTPVSIIPETAPGAAFQGKIDFVDPFYQPGSKTISARIYFNNKKLQIPIGSQVKAEIQIRSQQADWLPRSAVLSLGLKNVVFVKQDNGFTVRKVMIGITAGNEVQILDGLNVNDSVASNAQFLVDSDSFIKIK